MEEDKYSSRKRTIINPKILKQIDDLVIKLGQIRDYVEEKEMGYE